VALLKFPDVLNKKCNVVLNQKEDILVGIDEIKKHFCGFQLNKVITIFASCKRVSKTKLELNKIFLNISRIKSAFSVMWCPYKTNITAKA